MLHTRADGTVKAQKCGGYAQGDGSIFPTLTDQRGMDCERKGTFQKNTEE